MFNQSTTADTKIAVLEERLSAYEMMLKRIDEAIQLMGKTGQNISKILAVHEQKIEQCEKSDDLVTRLISDLKDENKAQHNDVSDRIKELEIKVEDVVKFRWIMVGVAIIVSFAVSQSSIVVDLLTPDQQPARVERTK